jgi:Pentapeptide repeats (8 copies)
MPTTIMHKGGQPLSGVPIISADSLRGADLSRLHLSAADFRKADLRGTDFSFCCLVGALFGGANAVGADFLGANLEWADLRGCHFQRARLKHTRLSGAVINWGSADLVSELLMRAAATQAQREWAVHGLVHDLCWAELLAIDHPEAAWSIEVLKPYVRPGDGAPDFLVAGRDMSARTDYLHYDPNPTPPAIPTS